MSIPRPRRSIEVAYAAMPDPGDSFLNDSLILLTTEFAARVHREMVADIVHDCYENLMTHVPRTAHIYLVPWARRRLLGRIGQHREPSVTEMLSIPPHRL